MHSTCQADQQHGRCEATEGFIIQSISKDHIGNKFVLWRTILSLHSLLLRSDLSAFFKMPSLCLVEQQIYELACCWQLGVLWAAVLQRLRLRAERNLWPQGAAQLWFSGSASISSHCDKLFHKFIDTLLLQGSVVCQVWYHLKEAWQSILVGVRWLESVGDTYISYISYTSWVFIQCCCTLAS